MQKKRLPEWGIRGEDAELFEDDVAVAGVCRMGSKDFNRQCVRSVFQTGDREYRIVVFFVKACGGSGEVNAVNLLADQAVCRFPIDQNPCLTVVDINRRMLLWV